LAAVTAYIVCRRSQIDQKSSSGKYLFTGKQPNQSNLFPIFIMTKDLFYMKKKYLLTILGGLFIALMIMTFRPVEIPDDIDDFLVAKGKVVHISEGGVHDVIFQLEGDRSPYYINLGLELGLDLTDLQIRLVGNEVTIRYPDHFSILNWSNASKHLSILEYNGEDIYNEVELLYRN